MSEEKKRIRRTFGTIILAKFDAKAEKIDPRKYEQFRNHLSGVLQEFDKLLDDAKAAKKADKRKYKSLKKFTKEELEAYLKTI